MSLAVWSVELKGHMMEAEATLSDDCGSECGCGLEGGGPSGVRENVELMLTLSGEMWVWDT